MKMQKLPAFFLFLFWFYAGAPNTNAQNWQYYHNPAAMPKYVPGLTLDANGQLWYTSGSIVGNFNGSTWKTYKFSDAGISIPYNTVRKLAGSPDGKIWCSGYGRVLTLTPLSNSWTLHNPSNSNNNLNGWDIRIAPSGAVYWADGGGYYTYDGSTWVRHYFYFPFPLGSNIEEYSVRDIVLDNDEQPWLITAGSLGIETGIITPPGIIHNSGSDTTVYKLFDMGYPTELSVPVTRNGQGYPMICVGITDAAGQRRLRLLSYEFGAWQNLGDSPPTQASVYEIFQDQIGNVWFVCNFNSTQPVVLRRYPNGDWSSYLLDNQEVTEIYTICTAANGDLWVGGRRGTEGVLIKSPLPPINPVQTAPEPCPPVKAFYANQHICFEGLPQDAPIRVSAMDTQGKLVYSGTVSNWSPEIPAAGWARGVYLLKLENDAACAMPTLKIFVAP